MQTPEQRDRVEHQVLQINRQVQRQHREQNCQRLRDVKEVEQTHAPPRGKCGDAYRGDGQRRTRQDAVEHCQSKIVGPAQRLARARGAPRRRQFPHCYDAEEAEKNAQPHRWLVTQEEGFHIQRSRCSVYGLALRW